MLKNFSSQERKVMVVLAMINFCHIMDFMIMMPLGPQLMRIFAISPQQFSYLVSIYTFSASIFGLMIASIVDAFDRKKFLMLTFTGFILGTFACALAPGYFALLMARMITGAFGGVMGSLVFSTLADLIPLERRGRAMGVLMTGFALASIVGVPMGLFLASLFGWHMPFVFLGTVSIAVMGLIYFQIPARHASGKMTNPLQLISRIIKNPAERWALGLTATLMYAHFLIVPFLSPSLVANVGFTEKQLTWIYFLGGSSSVFTSPIVGRLVDRFGMYRVYAFFCFTAVIPITLITHLTPVPVWVGLMVTTSFFMLAGSRMIPGTTMATAVVGAEQRGSFMSINSSLQNFCLSAATLTAGLIIVRAEDGHLLHYNRVGYLAIVVGFISLFMASRVKRYLRF